MQGGEVHHANKQISTICVLLVFSEGCAMSVQCTNIDELVLELHGWVSCHMMSCGSHYKCQSAICDTCVMYLHERVPPGVVTWPAQAWVRSLSVKPLATQQHSKLQTVLTHEYTGSLGVCPWKCGGGEKGSRGGEVQYHAKPINTAWADCG